MKRIFTLIELLVVIAIIAILAGMLLPALQGARASGQAAACKGNIKNIGMYVFMYTETYDGYIPTIFDGRRSASTQWVWPMLESLGIGLTKENYKYKGCPAPHPRISEKEASNQYAPFYDFALYSYNAYLGYYTDTGAVGTSWSQNYGISKLNRVINPSFKFLSADTSLNVTLAYIRYYADYTQDTIGWVHAGSSNVIYLDGHSETNKYSDFPTVTSLTDNAVTDKYLKPDKK